jgi:hypothetical protein
MNRSKDRLAVARALGVALGPIVELCLAVGLTSPELESILRAVFVKRAIVKLPALRTSSKPASDVRVGLAAGLHRNEVRRIRSVKEEFTLEKRQRRRRTERLIAGWATDTRFINSGGHPRDLPLISPDRGPSFHELASKYLPGVSPGTAVRELRRQDLIQVLPDEVVRLRASVSGSSGFSASTIASAGKRLQRLASTILFDAQGSDSGKLYKEINILDISPQILPLVRRTLERRTQVFLDAIERELQSHASGGRKRRRVRIGISVVSWQDD